MTVDVDAYDGRRPLPSNRGGNREHWHSKSKRKPKGFGRGLNSSPRIAVSLADDDFRRLQWLADKRGVPLSSVVRDAVWA